MNKLFSVSHYLLKKLKLPGAAFLLFLVIIPLLPLPKPLFPANYATLLSAADGQLLGARIAADGQWRFPAADTVPFKFRTAIVLFEDEYFFHHPGINPVSLGRAFFQNARQGKVVSGGSTLSMQVIRMALGNQNRTIAQKLKEMLLALKLELLYSKREILSLYAYHAPFGGNVVGLNAASWRYFGRSPHQLSWAEAASLAVLPNSPASIFPGKNERDFRRKRDFLLNKLASRGYLSGDELLLAQAEPLPGKVKPLPDHAYHLLQRAEKEGHSGTNVLSTLDAKLQLAVKDKVERYSTQLAGNEIHNAAALVIEAESGRVLAYVGNSGSTDENHGHYVDVITARRSPGSLLKPFLYAAAMDEGLLLPKELLPDIPLFYRGFAPQNFDKKYRGAVPADVALAGSLNVPFVYLLREYGYEKFHQKLQRLGMTSLSQPAGHYGLSMILGGADATLWELTAMYAGLVRTSQKYLERPYNKGYSASDYRPNNYLLNSPANTETEAEYEAYGPLSFTSVLYTIRAMQQLRRPEEMAGSELFGSYRPIAWKTGTSFGFRDGWAIGFNSRYVVGVWIGNADGEGRPGLTGIRAASPLMFSIFELLGGDASFEEPMGLSVSICSKSGLRATTDCEQTVEMQLPGYMPAGRFCTYHKLLHLDQAGQFQVNSSCYPVGQMVEQPWFVLPAVQSWYYRQYHPGYKEPPAFARNCSGQAGLALMELIYPRQFTKVYVPVEQDGKPGLAVFEAAHRVASAKIFWHLDNTYAGSTSHIHQMGFRPEPGHHILTLVDQDGNELRQEFEVIR